MAARNPQTQAKRARELALRERRDRKREAAARRAAGEPPAWETAAQDDPQTEQDPSS
jgi:hypothetical protein